MESCSSRSWDSAIMNAGNSVTEVETDHNIFSNAARG